MGLVEPRYSLYTGAMLDELKRLKKAVRDKCLECSGGTPAEVALCELEDCPLFPFRLELWPSLFDGGRANGRAGAEPGGEEGGEDGGESRARPELPEQFKLF